MFQAIHRYLWRKKPVSTLNKTHPDTQDFHLDVAMNLKRSISLRGDLPHVSVRQQIELIDDLLSFPLGQFFLEKKGANGFWTDYIIQHPHAKTNHCEKLLSPTERFILTKCPLTLATRERFTIFQFETQTRLKEGCVLLSIPCGVMRDLLTLDFSALSSFSLIGVDIDPESLSLAETLAKTLSLERFCTFLEEDAWQLTLEQPIDLITSSGLNVYVTDKEKIRSLYRNFHRLLRKGGTVITSVLTHPPDHAHPSEWIVRDMPQADILMEKILFQDILGSKWSNFQSSQEACEDFRSVGFQNVRILFDQHHIFPTIVAEK